MNVLARKTKQTMVLTVYLIFGILIMGAAFLVLPIGVFARSPELLTNLYLWGAVVLGMLFFGSIGFFGFVRPYILFRKLPEIQAETDGTYLYIHSKKEAKIPLADMDGTYLDATTPYVMSQEFIVHLLSDRYGDVIIQVPGYGKYKLYFISRAQDVPAVIAALVANQ